MREQLYLKEQGAEFVSYDVQYFDSLSIMDPMYLNVINLHLDHVKQQYETKTVDLLVLNKNLKMKVEHLQLQNQNADTPAQLIQKAFKLEPDPYCLWKILQDVLGSLFFKEVFE